MLLSGAGKPLAFGKLIENALSILPNGCERFSEQTVCNEKAACVGTIEGLLQSVPQNMEGIGLLLQAHDGICAPTPINLQASALLYLLGVMPKVPGFPTMKIDPSSPAVAADLGRRHVLHNFGAHDLRNIFEADHVTGSAECPTACFAQKYASLCE